MLSLQLFNSIQEVKLMNRQGHLCPRRFHAPLLIALFCLAAFMIPWQGISAQGAQFTSAQLESLVAPVALYPDDLLSNVLTASTVPDQVNQAALYLRSQGGKVSSMPDSDWDPSVKGLLSFPDVLNKLDGDINWTKQLGDAVINQMNDVLAAVQAFRSKAMSAGNLQSNSQQQVSTSQDQIVIAPTNPEVIYVPQYEPTQVVNAGYPVATFAAGVAVSNWWHCNTVNWGAGNIWTNPAYMSHYNYRPGGAYYNNYMPRPGYPAAAAGPWRPVATPYGNTAVGRYGNTAAGNTVGRYGNTAAGNTAVRTGANINTGNTVNVNTGGNTLNNANMNRTNANVNNAAMNRTTNAANMNRSTADINKQINQGLRTQTGAAGTGAAGRGTAGSRSYVGSGRTSFSSPAVSNTAANRSNNAFGGMNSGAAVRNDSARGAASRSSFQGSSGSMNRGGGGFGGGSRGGGRRR
jgi:hypothetical protein